MYTIESLYTLLIEHCIRAESLYTLLVITRYLKLLNRNSRRTLRHNVTLKKHETLRYGDGTGTPRIWY